MTRAPRLSASAAHRVRVGTGLDAIALRATGRGFVFGSAGVFRVSGVLERVVFSNQRPWFVFIGLHGLSWVRLTLPSRQSVQWPARADVVLPSSPPSPLVLISAVPVRTLTIAVPDAQERP